MCHASNICVLNNNDILVAWFGGTREGEDDTAIWIARYTEDAWQEAVKVEDTYNVPHWNPILFQQIDGTLLLFYKIGKEIKSWKTMYRYSNDYGMTWSSPKELVEGDTGGRGPVRNKIIRLSDNSIIAGASIESGIWYAFADRSIDNGETWEKSNHIYIEGIKYQGHKTVNHSNIPVSEQSFYGRGVIQPTIWESKPGFVHMLLRSSERLIYRSDSSDYGKTWGNAYPTTLPNNNSGIDVVKLENGSLVLCYNPISENWGARTPLSLTISNDNGNTWEHLLHLENTEGEYSYPSIVSKNNNIYVSYTWNRKYIAFVHLQLLT
jgi:predicted neuraminidase